MNKEVYIVTDHDTNYSKAVKMTNEQAEAISWFIDEFEMECSCVKPDDLNCEEI